jgi:hypothetical protein
MEKPAPKQRILIKSLAADSPYFEAEFDKVELLGAESVTYNFGKTGLEIRLPDIQDLPAPLVLKIY